MFAPGTEDRRNSLWSPANPDSIDCLQIVYKVAERCNINCSYCYYFNMGYDAPLARPVRASLDVSRRFAKWLAQGCAELNIPKLKMSFHGGEPLLIGPELFDETCRVILEEVSPVAAVSFSVQTNGTLINDRWQSVFQRYQVAVGVSIDGDREAHDRFRLDHRGRSTFDVTEANLLRLVELAGDDPGKLPSTISVLDHRGDYRQTYAYLRGLGIQAMGFLLPDRTFDDQEFKMSGHAAAYGERLAELFEAWFAENNPEIQVRFIDKVLRHFRVSNEPGRVRRQRKSVQILVAQSDGTVTLDDSYVPALDWYSDTPEFPIGEKSLREVFSDPVFLKIEELEHTPPTACESCQWKTMCGGGDLENRYSVNNGFDNPSIYCDSYKIFYGTLCDTLVKNGYPAEEIERRVGWDAGTAVV